MAPIFQDPKRGWIDAQHRIPGCPMPHGDAELESHWLTRLREAPLYLDEASRFLTMGALLSVCKHRAWLPHAIHVRTTHVHAVITGSIKPERILSDLKAYATRALRFRTGESPRRCYWANHGSTRYLWKQTGLHAAIDYTLNRQGIRMACFPDDRTDIQTQVPTPNRTL